MKRRISLAEIADREAIAETRRRYYEALAGGMSIEAAAEHSKGAPASTSRSEAPLPGEVKPRDLVRTVEIPADWQTLPYVPRNAGAPSLKALASQVSDTPVRNKPEAEAAIQLELDRRANEAAEARAAVIIPDDWQGLSLEEGINLASQFTSEEVKTAGDIERAIHAELARRAG